MRIITSCLLCNTRIFLENLISLLEEFKTQVSFCSAIIISRFAMTYIRMRATNCQNVQWDKSSLKLQYQKSTSRTEQKFDLWITKLKDEWNDEIAACLQGEFPDWRS